MHSLYKSIVYAALLFFCTFPLCARDVQIMVIDADLVLVLEGAVIRSWDGKEYVCDNAGITLLSVPDGMRVTVQAVYPGYMPARLLINTDSDVYTIKLRLSEAMEGNELLIEAQQPGTNETRTGQSVAIFGEELSMSAQIGAIEDLMTAVKLLPGVGYTGFMNAMPSIRGGDPGDMKASLDGFYIFHPYHQGGFYSIFDPRMVSSAKLSHGVFSGRYGHTVSGLLDVNSRKPSPDNAELELGLSTSAAAFDISLPLAGKGGVICMGRVSFYDPFIWAAKELAKSIEALEAVNVIETAPYVRSGTITGNYRFIDNLELNATGFFGMDGMGIHYESPDNETNMLLEMNNYQAFYTSMLSWNPRNDMLLKISAGTGYQSMGFDMDWQEEHNGLSAEQSDRVFNVQGRVDYDWELSGAFLVAAGVQEMFSVISNEGEHRGLSEQALHDLAPGDQAIILGLSGSSNPDELPIMVAYPFAFNSITENTIFASSAYSLVEYNSPNKRISSELGLRIDHYYLTDGEFNVSSKAVLNPRFNMDFIVLRNRGPLESLQLTAGTGLFSALNANAIDTGLFSGTKTFGTGLFSSAAINAFGLDGLGINDYKPLRSWTSVLGMLIELPENLNITVEAYYKYLFDRLYIPIEYNLDAAAAQLQFDGIGRAWGIDLMLHKMKSRFLDGWLSYSYNWTKYRDQNNDWYFPSYHRFHNLNLALNYKPRQQFNIYTHLSVASGLQIPKLSGDGPSRYQVYMYDPETPADSYFFDKYYWPAENDSLKRIPPSLKLDIKFSFYGSSRSGKSVYELYAAIENILGLVYTAQGNPGFNQYTGELDTGLMSASYDMPIPVPSFGFKVSY